MSTAIRQETTSSPPGEHAGELLTRFPGELREQFPVLRREFDGRPLVYLDSAATSQTPQAVIDAMTRYYTESRGAIHPGG
jgi:selenocysteine lyase/cysteine desulfurase